MDTTTRWLNVLAILLFVIGGSMWGVVIYSLMTNYSLVIQGCT